MRIFKFTIIRYYLTCVTYKTIVTPGLNTDHKIMIQYKFREVVVDQKTEEVLQSIEGLPRNIH